MNKELQEVELDTKQCAEVALYMYEQWQKAMEPPLFIFKSFPDWLATLKGDTTNEPNKLKGEK